MYLGEVYVTNPSLYLRRREVVLNVRLLINSRNGTPITSSTPKAVFYLWYFRKSKVLWLIIPRAYFEGISTSLLLKEAFSVDMNWLPRWLREERLCLQFRRPGFNSLVGKIPWRRKWQPTPVFLPGKSHEQMCLAGYIVHEVTKSQTQLSD